MLVGANAVSDALNSSEWVFPIFECFHITALAWSIGMIALVDLRLLGVGIQHSTSSELARATELWTLIGLSTVLMSGPVLFLSDPRMYLYNSSFRFKMYALAIALIFNFTIHRKVALSDGSPRLFRVLTAVVSLALWASVVFGGLFIAFV
jgi:uncharacterized membrane protein